MWCRVIEVESGLLVTKVQKRCVESKTAPQNPPSEDMHIGAAAQAAAPATPQKKKGKRKQPATPQKPTGKPGRQRRRGDKSRSE